MHRSLHRLALLACMWSMLATSPASADTAVDRGAYLVNGFGCSDCHTPFRMGPKGPAPDVARGLSGHPQDVVLPPPPAPSGPWLSASAATNTAFAGPWGVSYAANLTPDPKTGIGAWTVENFVNAMRTGKHLGVGRRILPPMPSRALGTMSDADLGAMFAYLMAQPAVSNVVPEPTPPAPR